jgi:hypothetical protein
MIVARRVLCVMNDMGDPEYRAMLRIDRLAPRCGAPRLRPQLLSAEAARQCGRSARLLAETRLLQPNPAASQIPQKT